jgi:N-acetylglucosaminyl-diphospho-decaprenol L-rhamnosyltransferase
MSQQILVSVILVSYNTAQLSLESLRYLFGSKGDFNLEVFVVDNASKDDSVAQIQKAYPLVHLEQNAVNIGFGRANNQVLSKLKGDYVLLLNTDAFVLEDTIAKTVAYMESNPSCGILGVRLIGRDHVQQPSCRYFPTPFNLFAFQLGLHRFFPSIHLVDPINWQADKTQSCDWVPGCYYLVRQKVIHDVGLFDPRYFLYSEEVDHCFAAKRAGWDVCYFADTTVVHIGGESAKSDGEISSTGRQLNVLQAESNLIYFRKNLGLFSCFQHVILVFIADFVSALKSLCKGEFNRLFKAFASTRLTLISAWRTRMGRVPIR